MLKLFVLSAVLALAAANNIDFFIGEWRAVKVFAKDPVVQECDPVTITEIKNYCKCGSDDKVSQVKMVIGPDHITFPGYFVDSFQGFTESLNTQCTCEGTNVGHYVLLRLSDNYFVMSFTEPGIEFMALLTKSVGSEAEINELVSKTEFLKTKQSFFVCSTEIMNNNESKVTTGKKWWDHKTL